MKNKEIPAVSKEKESGPGSNPENMFTKSKKSSTTASVDNLITGAVGKVKARSGRGLKNDGTNIDYNEGA